MPGWCKGTVGYHIDDGRIFDAENPTMGKEYKGEIIISKNFRQGLGLSPCYPVFSNPFVGDKVPINALNP